VIYLGGLEELEHSVADTGGDEADTFVLATDEVADDEAETARVHIGNVRKVEDVDRSGMAWSRFRLEEVLEGGGGQSGVHVAGRKWTGKAEDQAVGNLVLRAFDMEAGTLPDLSRNSGHRVSVRHGVPRWLPL